MEKVKFSYGKLSRKEAEKQLEDLPAGTILDITDTNGTVREDVNVDDELEALSKANGNGLANNFQAQGYTARANRMEVPAEFAPKKTIVDCTINHVSRAITSRRTGAIFHFVTYTDQKGVTNQIPVNAGFIAGNDQIVGDAALRLEISHNIGGKTKYVQNYDDGRASELLTHVETGDSISNAIPLTKLQVEELQLDQKLVIDGKKSDALYESMKKYAEKPELLKAMTTVLASRAL